MAFVLTIVQLEEALKQPGCAVCRLSLKAVHKSAEGFLYENTLDPQVREPVLKSRGFCPEHTRLLAAIELSSDGSTLGLNYIYEQLSRIVAEELPSLSASRPATSLLAHLKLNTKKTPLPPCPFCKLAAESDENYLSALFEEMESETSATREKYLNSDGLCYPHLRAGLERYGSACRGASAFLVEQTRGKLLQGSTHMQEYIRKHDWHYRDEKVSPEEQTAWKSALAFFTGLPEDKFTHKLEP